MELIQPDISKTLIRNYLKAHSASMMYSLEEANDNPEILASLVAQAMRTGLRIHNRNRKAHLSYYDEYIKPENMSLPRISKNANSKINKTMELSKPPNEYSDSSDGERLNKSELKPSSKTIEHSTIIHKIRVKKPSVETTPCKLKLPWLFPKKSHTEKTEKNSSTICKIIDRKRKKLLNRDSDDNSQGSSISLHSCIFINKVLY